MINIRTELVSSSRTRDSRVAILQNVVEGPKGVVHRPVTLYLNSINEAIVLALKILKEHVPATALKGFDVELKLLSDSVNTKGDTDDGIQGAIDGLA